MAAHSLSVIIPAHEEALWIEKCLKAVLASSGVLPKREVIVVANGCGDDTAARARALSQRTEDWRLRVIETEIPGKPGALNLGDEAAQGDIRVYLDADVTVSTTLLAELTGALTVQGARYATGTPRISQVVSRASRAYARFWKQLPFVTQGTPGFGLFAMSDLGRARFDRWPDIIADDMFARLNFTPSERIRVPATYDWPPVEGFGNLIRVRRRQNAGVAELARRYPSMMVNEDQPTPGAARILRLALRDPSGFAAYAGVALGVRSPFFSGRKRWARGR